ncbi:cupin domain-containing protein [Metabacillus sp. RGM 3146]|uniref:cupin domain-containing protein n=1 Tax=Metabacillus sp. RGM 3146 TaxID=3401092 RepID=UPI003B9CF2C5
MLSAYYRAGDVGYVPFAMGHYFKKTGRQSLWFLEMFKNNRFADVLLKQWMALTPKELIQEHLNIGRELINGLRKEKWAVFKYNGI